MWEWEEGNGGIGKKGRVYPHRRGREHRCEENR
jgi:hypothetical protein